MISQKQKDCTRSNVQVAIKSGRLVKPTNCSKCGRDDMRIEGHHKDYAKPLDVVWLCTSCHQKGHGPHGPRIIDNRRTFQGHILPYLDQSPVVFVGLIRDSGNADEHEYYEEDIDWEPYLALLTFRQKTVIELRYGFDGPAGTFMEIAKIFRVTKERVRQIHQRAIEQIREQYLSKEIVALFF